MAKRSGRRRAQGFWGGLPSLSAQRSRLVLPDHLLGRVDLARLSELPGSRISWEPRLGFDGADADPAPADWAECEMGQSLAALAGEARSREAQADEELREVEAKLELLRFRAAHRAQRASFWTQLLLLAFALAGMASTGVLGLLYYDARTSCRATQKPLVEGLADGAQKLVAAAAELAHKNRTLGA
jgi:hypothetical protein